MKNITGVLVTEDLGEIVKW